MTTQEFETAVKESVDKLYELYKEVECDGECILSVTVSDDYKRYSFYKVVKEYPTVFGKTEFPEKGAVLEN